MITTSQAPGTSPPDVQATLLALLGQAAQITGQGQPPMCEAFIACLFCQ